MAHRPFHHGNLREVLLEHAEETLRQEGVDKLSLRELARQAEVSHGAPRSHFADRQALLDALAERGFDRFTDRIRHSLTTQGTLTQQLQNVGRAYVDFAVESPALMELMFSVKLTTPAVSVHDAAIRLFQVLDSTFDHLPSGDGIMGRSVENSLRDRFKLLFAATMQGTALLITTKRITPDQGEILIQDATAALLTSRLGQDLLVNSPPDAGSA